MPVYRVTFALSAIESVMIVVLQFLVNNVEVPNIIIIFSNTHFNANLLGFNFTLAQHYSYQVPDKPVHKHYLGWKFHQTNRS